MNKLWLGIGKLLFWLTWPALWIYLKIGKRTRLLLVCEDEFLVLKGWLGNGNWMLPGGGLHRGEEPVTGLMREVFEETGIKIDKNLLRHAYDEVSNQYGLKFRYSCFVLKLPNKPQIKTQRGEIVDYAWQPLKKPLLPISQDAMKAVQWWINKG